MFNVNKIYRPNTQKRRTKMINVRIAKADKCNEDYSMFISFNYNQKIVDTIKSYPTKFWNKDTKEWEVPLKRLVNLTTDLSDFDFDIIGKYVELDSKSVKIPPEFKFKTKPFEHQMNGFNYGLQNGKWLLGDEQGLGKTKQVIDIAVVRKLALGYKHCLIICGVNGLKWNWYNEVLTHSDEKPYILGQRTKRNGSIVVGGNADKLADIKNIDSIDAYFIITNIETLRDADIIDELVKLCKNGTISMIAADECHKMKNPSSQQGKAFLKLKTNTMIAMTGTPLMNNPMDLYIILKWLGYEKYPFYAFKKHYCVMGGFGGYEIIGYRNLDELQERLNEIMLRRLKSEVLDLPEKTYIDEYVEMTAKQAIVYKEVTAEIKANIDSIKMVNNPLAELIRMRQATGYTGILSSKIEESAKLDRMEELVADAVENGNKVVIFSNWTQMTTLIAKRLAKYNPAIITGEINTDTRQQMIDKFQNDNSCKVIVGTIGAMGTGLTLTEGTVEIFLDHPWNRALYDQAVDRCHRIGQKNNVTIYNLLCKGTIDERIWEIVNKKGMMSDYMVDGKVDSMHKVELLNYLIG